MLYLFVIFCYVILFINHVIYCHVMSHNMCCYVCYVIAIVVKRLCYIITIYYINL